jgi:hypothetical protein
VTDYAGFDPAASRNSRPGVAARRAVGLGLCLVLFAGLTAACSGSKSSGASASSEQSSQSTGQSTQTSASAETSASAQTGASAETSAAASAAASVSLDPTLYQADGGGFGVNGSIDDYGYTDRYTEGTSGLDHMGAAYALIVQALPAAVDLNQTQAEEPGSISENVYIQWSPMGRHQTALPPGNHGERLYEVDIDLGPYLQGGDALAYIWFITKAQADALDPHNMTATPSPFPTTAYEFQIDKTTAAALLDMFWVKGAAPTAS